MGSPRRFAFTFAVLGLASVACGSSSNDGGSGGNGDAGIPVPDSCKPSGSAGSPPYAVTLQLVNQGSSTLWVGHTCGGEAYEVAACADGYATPLSISPGCTSCTATSCMACPNVCRDETHSIAPGSSFSVSWDGTFYTVGQLAGHTCECTAQRDAPASKYRARVPVFASKPTDSAPPLRVAEVNFELPTTGAIQVRIDN